MIYHVTTKNAWQQALENKFYECESLHTEGFIHLSKANQVEGVLNRYYKNATDVLLLFVDYKEGDEGLKFELAPSVNEYFPHIFHPIPTNKIVHVLPIDENDNWKKELVVE